MVWGSLLWDATCVSQLSIPMTPCLRKPAKRRKDTFCSRFQPTSTPWLQCTSAAVSKLVWLGAFNGAGLPSSVAGHVRGREEGRKGIGRRREGREKKWKREERRGSEREERVREIKIYPSM